MASFGPANAAGAGAAFAARGAPAIDAAMQVDDALDHMRVATGKTGPALQQREKDFREVWTSGPEGAKEVSDAIAKLNQVLELTGPQLQTLTRQILDLARITGED